MIQVFSFIFWLLIVPFYIGMVPVKFISEEKRNPGVILLAGYLLMWAVFEVITIPAVVWVQYHNFSIAMNIFTVVAILLAVAGINLWYLEGRKNGGKTNWLKFGNLKWAEMSLETKIAWFLFLALVGFQLYMSVTRASFDGDDAYYVVQSLMAQQNDAMYKNLPYTGRSADLDVRHALAVFPMWVAFVAVKANLHATIVSHVIMPLVLIPLSYLVYYEISKVLFRENECHNLDEYNKRTGKALQRYIFACDEVAEILDKTGLTKDQKDKVSLIESKLSVIARQGRAFGIHLILATQRPDANILSGQIRNNIDCRVCGRADNVLSQIILDSTAAAEQIPKDAAGRFLLHDGTIFQAFWFDDTDM